MVLVVNRPSGTMIVSPKQSSGSSSVAALLPGFGSPMPAGTATVAVFRRLVGVALSVPVRVYVAVAPTGRFTVSLMFPEPLGVQVAPPAATQVQVGGMRAAGTVSV